MILHVALGMASAIASVIPASGWIHQGDRLAGAGIVATPAGVVYFVDRARDVVWRLEEGRLQAVVSGRRVRTLQLAADSALIGISRDERGTEAWLLRPDGTVEPLAREGRGLGLAMDRRGRLYAWSRAGRSEPVRLWRTDGAGHRFELAGGGSGGAPGGGRPGELRGGGGRMPECDVAFFPIGAMTLAPDGSMLVTSGPTVRRVTEDGQVQMVADGSKWLRSRLSFLQQLLGVVRGHLAAIAADTSGAIYVANAGRDLVARIFRGETTRFYESPRGWRPVGITVQQDRVYVLEYGAGVRVKVLDRQGRAVGEWADSNGRT